MTRLIFIFWTIALCCDNVLANVRLPKIFADNMILQRDQPIPVWGWADPKESVIVVFKNQQKKTVAASNGKWMINLDAEQAGGPYELTIKGKNNISISNVLIGEVWVCSGQSNMEMPIAGWGKVNNYKQEIANASYPQIRQYHVTKTVSAFPQNDVAGNWAICSPLTAGDFSATAYFFARELYNQLHVPIGIINTSWGGSMIETWISRDAFEKSAEFKSMILNISADSINNQMEQKDNALSKAIAQLKFNSLDTVAKTHWKDESYNDSQWPTMLLPGFWEKQNMGLDDLDGKVAFRKTFIVADSDVNKPGVIQIGQADDLAEVFVNNISLARAKNDEGENVYPVCPGILNAGKNVIAITIEDNGGLGGIFASNEDMRLDISMKSYPLAGKWHFWIDSVYHLKNPNSYPTLLFNAMINPLIPFAIKGVIWYQGETNAGRAYQYRKAFPLMIDDWRNHWDEGNFPFYFVQLSSFDPNGGNGQKGSTWAELREAQKMTLMLPNTGMAVTTDIGNTNDIHPKDKQDVGKRLAYIALAKTYSLPVKFNGSDYASMKIQNSKIIISFDTTNGGLKSNDKYGYIRGFEIAGEDQKFHWAQAVIDGGGNVEISSSEVKQPVEVRYGWADDAGEANLFDHNGFPVAPFRSDSWRGNTYSEKYKVLP